ncbi:MAG: hypothetical protein ACI90V_011943 [Bacillariaceae sp.]|jgi:hypothetical protein
MLCFMCMGQPFNRIWGSRTQPVRAEQVSSNTFRKNKVPLNYGVLVHPDDISYTICKKS